MRWEAGGAPFSMRAEKADARNAARRAVLRAAVRMFNASGHHATLLEHVAASLGISKPTIYHSGKEQVLLECIAVGLIEEAIAAQMIDILTARLAPRD